MTDDEFREDQLLRIFKERPRPYQPTRIIVGAAVWRAFSKACDDMGLEPNINNFLAWQSAPK